MISSKFLVFSKTNVEQSFLRCFSDAYRASGYAGIRNLALTLKRGYFAELKDGIQDECAIIMFAIDHGNVDTCTDFHIDLYKADISYLFNV